MIKVVLFNMVSIMITCAVVSLIFNMNMNTFIFGWLAGKIVNELIWPVWAVWTGQND